MIKLGATVRDPLTGLTGIAIVRSEWLWGCIRIGLQPNEVKDGKPVEETWFDENRLEIVKEEKEKKSILQHGGPEREGRKIIEG